MVCRFLEDIIEMNHYLLRMLERFINDRHGVLFTRKKIKKRNKEKDGGCASEDEEEEDRDDYKYSESKLEFKQVELVSSSDLFSCFILRLIGICKRIHCHNISNFASRLWAHQAWKHHAYHKDVSSHFCEMWNASLVLQGMSTVQEGLNNAQ
jgi:hypothetical protein